MNSSVPKKTIVKITNPIKTLLICLIVILVACVGAMAVIRFSNSDQEDYTKHHFSKTFQIRAEYKNDIKPKKVPQDLQEVICDIIVDNDREMKAIYLKCLDCWDRGYRLGDEAAWDSIQYCINQMYDLFVERSVGMDSVMKWKLHFNYILKESDWESGWHHGEKVCPSFVW